MAAKGLHVVVACIRGIPIPKLRSFLWFGGQIEYFEAMSTELVRKDSSNLSSSLRYDIRVSKEGKFRGFSTSLGDSVATRPVVGSPHKLLGAGSKD